LRVSLYGVEGIFCSNRDDGYHEFVRQSFDQIQRAALLSIGSGQQLMRLVDYQHLQADLAQQTQGDVLECG
jgi:hypothetical protein